MVPGLLQPSWARAGTWAAASGAQPREVTEEESRMESQYTDLKPLQNPNLMGEDDIKQKVAFSRVP